MISSHAVWAAGGLGGPLARRTPAETPDVPLGREPRAPHRLDPPGGRQRRPGQGDLPLLRQPPRHGRRPPPGDPHRDRPAVPGGAHRAGGPGHDLVELHTPASPPGTRPHRLHRAGPRRAPAHRPGGDPHRTGPRSSGPAVLGSAPTRPAGSRGERERPVDPRPRGCPRPPLHHSWRPPRAPTDPCDGPRGRCRRSADGGRRCRRQRPHPLRQNRRVEDPLRTAHAAVRTQPVLCRTDVRIPRQTGVGAGRHGSTCACCRSTWSRTTRRTRTPGR